MTGNEGVKTFYFGFLALGLIIGAILGLAVGGYVFPQNQAQTGLPHAVHELTPEEAGAQVIDFVADYAVPPEVNVSLTSVTEVENANLYKITLELSMLGTSETQELYLTKDGKTLFPGSVDIEEFMAMVELQEEQEEKRAQEQQQEPTIGNFVESSEALCTENGKPVVYFFGNDNCNACRWEHPVIENVTAKFEGYIAFHNNMNVIDADIDVFNRYSSGSIPTIVLGCNYYRVGAGVNLGEDQEEKVLTALICTLTNNKPEDVCTDHEIVALIDQIEQ